MSRRGGPAVATKVVTSPPGSPPAVTAQDTVGVGAIVYGVLEPGRLRPVRSSFQFAVDLTTGDPNQPLFSHGITSEFDWGHGEGCE